MKTDLKRDWVILCLGPFGVREEHMDKFVACLIGDELCTEEEFRAMFEGHGAIGSGIALERNAHGRYVSGCKYCVHGTCFHPFLPGSLIDGIYADAFRNQPTARVLVDDRAVGALDGRRCECCSMYLPSEVHDTAFGGLEMFYGNLFDDVANYWYEAKFEKIRGDLHQYIDGRGYFKDGSVYSPYEKNIRRHFDALMERHFRMIDDACRERHLGVKESENPVSKAVMRVKWELVTHYMNYWAPEKFKAEEA